MAWISPIYDRTENDQISASAAIAEYKKQPIGTNVQEYSRWLSINNTQRRGIFNADDLSRISGNLYFLLSVVQDMFGAGSVLLAESSSNENEYTVTFHVTSDGIVAEQSLTLKKEFTYEDNVIFYGEYPEETNNSPNDFSSIISAIVLIPYSCKMQEVINYYEQSGEIKISGDHWLTYELLNQIEYLQFVINKYIEEQHGIVVPISGVYVSGVSLILPKKY